MESTDPLNNSETATEVDATSADGTQVKELESKLRDKEKLVAELTKRLERAAEQLDRVHRTGGDKALRVAGGIPPELIDEQQALVGELQKAIDQWMEAQPTAALSRIEMQIGEVRDLVAGRVVGGMPSEPPPAESTAAPTKEAPPAAQPTGSPSSWEALKASLMGDDAPNEGASAPAADAEGAAPGGWDEASPGVQVEMIPAADVPDLPEAPADLDLEAASAEELRAAVEERDTFIMTVLKRLRAAEARQVYKVDWESIEGVPEELTAQVQDLEAKLKETLRVAEVELSIERARLGREENRLTQLEHTVETKMRKLGLDVDGEDDGSGDAGGSSESKHSRWFGMLGLGGE
jgi:hypothetical protein